MDRTTGRPIPAVLRGAFLALVWQGFALLCVAQANAADFGRTGGGGAGEVRVGCEPLFDSNGHKVATEKMRGKSGFGHCQPTRPARVPKAVAQMPKTEATPPEAAVQPVIAEPEAPAIELEEPSSGEDAQVLILKLEPAGVGMALGSGGLLFWLIRSGMWTMLLAFGLPIWRDLDLLPIVAREAETPAESPDYPEEDVFARHSRESGAGAPGVPS